MFRKATLTYLLLLMTAIGTGSFTRPTAGAAPSPVTVQVTDAIPTAPTAPAAAAAAERAPMTVAQMTDAKGDGIWGWLKKIWNKHKKKIIKIIWEIIQILTDTVTTTTSSYQEGISGEVTEYHEGTEETENVYASQADYDAGTVSSSSYVDYGYSYSGTDYSGGSYE